MNSASLDQDSGWDMDSVECPHCGEYEDIDFLGLEYDGDEGGVYAYPTFHCNTCNKDF